MPSRGHVPTSGPSSMYPCVEWAYRGDWGQWVFMSFCRVWQSSHQQVWPTGRQQATGRPAKVLCCKHKLYLNSTPMGSRHSKSNKCTGMGGMEKAQCALGDVLDNPCLYLLCTCTKRTGANEIHWAESYLCKVLMPLAWALQFSPGLC